MRTEKGRDWDKIPSSPRPPHSPGLVCGPQRPGSTEGGSLQGGEPAGPSSGGGFTGGAEVKARDQSVAETQVADAALQPRKT